MKAFRIFLLILIIIGLTLIFTRKYWVPQFVDHILEWERGGKAEVVASQEEKKTVSPVVITSKEIKEENFIGKMPVISGSSLVAKEARKYIDVAVAEFRKLADEDVPDIREKFGADSPSANYETEINAEYLMGPKTESIILRIYVFTGGAHGNTRYKVITVSIADKKVLTLSNIIKADKKDLFTAYVKKELNDWRPDASSGLVVFPDEVSELEFSSFSNWSLNDKNLIIYFDQYAIGPGVLGVVAFPLSLSKISNFLQ